MASMEGLKTRALLASGVSTYQGTDKAVAIRLRYIGTGTVTSVATINATSVTTITSDGGTDAFAFATYTTIGAVVDAINSLGIFEAKAVDVLRSAASAGALLAETLTTPTADENGNAVFDVKVDTSLMFYAGACLSASRGFGGLTAGHRVHLQEIAYVANMNAAAADQLKVYARDCKTKAERLVYAGLSVDTTATTVTFASGLGKISSKDNEELIVTIKDDTSMADGAYMKLTGIVE
jgi:hypothetical protein